MTLDTENMRARSVDTVMKELYGSAIAYNLVVQFRREAARRVGPKPRRLSFSDTWLDFRHGLLLKTADNREQWQLRYACTLASASQRVLPDRRRKRSYPRISYTRPARKTKFEKLQRAEAAALRAQKQSQSLE